MFFVSNLIQQVCNTVVGIIPIAPVDDVITALCSSIIGVLRSVNL